MNNPSGKILLELLLSPDTPSELFLEYKKQLLLYLTAGEEAVKKVAELENDKRELVETLDTILQICHDYPLSCRARVIEKAENTIAKHKEAL